MSYEEFWDLVDAMVRRRSGSATFSRIDIASMSRRGVVRQTAVFLAENGCEIRVRFRNSRVGYRLGW